MTPACNQGALEVSGCLAGQVRRFWINAVFGTHHSVQRCRTHKLRNVLEFDESRVTLTRGSRA